MSGRRSRPGRGVEDPERAAERAVAERVGETAGLDGARGAAFDVRVERGVRRYRRRPGLEHLTVKGRLRPEQRRAGERYGQCYRIVAETGGLASCLAPASDGGGGDLAGVLRRAESRALAQAELAGYRARLGGQPDLVGACDRICGEELTPREAAGEERAALRLEAVLAVALDLLIGSQCSRNVLDCRAEI